jgi:hypothetical protein
MGNSIVDYYRGVASDDRGRFLQDILGWPDDALESVHDYIQWLFPTFEPSAYNPTAPLLDEAIVATFQSDPALKLGLAAAFDRLLSFYGFMALRFDVLTILPAANFQQRAKIWMRPRNHNHLRITRILKSLSALGLVIEAREFERSLEQLYRDDPTMREAVSQTTLHFWRSAVDSRHHS